MKENVLENLEYRKDSVMIEVKIKNHGAIKIRIMPLIAPIATARMLTMVKMKKYDGKVIERLEPGFVIQPLFQDGVDEDIDVMVEPEYRNNAINHGIEFDRGVVAMAGDENNASGAQFFITLDKHPRLNGNFTVVGIVEDGWDEVERLERVKVMECIDEASNFTYHKPEVDEVVEYITIL